MLVFSKQLKTILNFSRVFNHHHLTKKKKEKKKLE
jgi:hypothetical protein